MGCQHKTYMVCDRNYTPMPYMNKGFIKCKGIKRNVAKKTINLVNLKSYLSKEQTQNLIRSTKQNILQLNKHNLHSARTIRTGLK